MPANIDCQFECYYMSDNLSTYDPYDLWKTNIGLKIKKTFNTNRLLGAFPALVLTLADQLLNNKFRFGYKKQEYPTVRALAAQILLHKYKESKETKFIIAAKKHLEWLKKNVSKGYSGACWGLGFNWPAASDIVYDANTPHATHTPYALEAFHLYTILSGDNEYVDLIRSCFKFYENDLYIMYEDKTMMATSYGPFKDRIATNAVSYVMYSYAIFLSYFPEQEAYILNKIRKLYQFISNKQQSNGSWLYIPDEEKSFIDCFHSCFIIKNLLKTQKIINLEGSNKIISNGYKYICENFYDKKVGLYKRFSKANKLSLVKYDLYDNSEMLNLAKMMGDLNQVSSLKTSIKKCFHKGNDIYSVIDFLNIKRNKNTLRWAVIPYLYASSTLK